MVHTCTGMANAKSYYTGDDALGLKNKVVLITGASSGLGYYTAVAFAEQGARLVLQGRDEAGLQRTVDDCIDVGLPGYKILTVKAELTNEADCDKVVDEAIKKYGTINVLINNAGIVKTGSFATCTLEDLDEALNINTRAMFVMTKKVLPYLNGTKGCIVNVSSFTAQRPINDYLAYCLSKTAVDQFTRNLALELGQINIRVNSVNPAIIRDTNLWLRPGLPLHKAKIFGAFILKKIGPMYPMHRPSTTDEIVPAILFFSSEKCSSFITGTNLLIDGGKALTSLV